MQVIECQKLKKELGIPLGGTVLLSVGEVNKNKNHKIVIESLPKLDNCYYVLCGQGPLMNEYKKLAENLGVCGRFIMTGYRTDIADFYYIADVFVFPSYREGLPVALMEAMAAGLICVAARNRGTYDLLERSELLFNAHNEKDLKAKLIHALTRVNNDEILENKKHLQPFDLINILSMIKNYYCEALN